MNNIDLGHLFFGFDGRINRGQIWLGLVLIWLIPIIGWIWALIELGFLPGTTGPNKYGPDPLAVGASEAV